MTIVTETRILIETALAGDPALASLVIAESSPETLTVNIARGIPAKSIGGSTYSPEPPFHRETLAELVLRMQRLRWRRAAPLTPLARPPEEQDLQALHGKHERAKVGFERAPGWTDLFDATFSWLNEIAANTDWSPSQIKEKYGTLRFYWYGDLPDLGAEIIDAAEHLSGHICETCGAPGELGTDGGWWSTRCRECRDRSLS